MHPSLYLKAKFLTRKNTFYYQPGDGMPMVRALEAARAFDRRKVDIEGIHSWASLARVFANGL